MVVINFNQSIALFIPTNIEYIQFLSCPHHTIFQNKSTFPSYYLQVLHLQSPRYSESLVCSPFLCICVKVSRVRSTLGDNITIIFKQDIFKVIIV